MPLKNFVFHKNLTTNLPISPPIVQHHPSKIAILGYGGKSIADALCPLVRVFAKTVVRDAVLHENVFVEHFQTIFHLRIVQ